MPDCVGFDAHGRTRMGIGQCRSSRQSHVVIGMEETEKLNKDKRIGYEGGFHGGFAVELQWTGIRGDKRGTPFSYGV